MHDQRPSSRPADGQVQPVTPERIMGMAWGYASTFTVGAAVETGVFDALADGPLDLGNLCSRTRCSVRGMRTLANALVGLGLLAHDAGHYRLTLESAAFLVSSSPGNLGRLFGVITHDILPSWTHLAAAVRSGAPDATMNREPQGTEFFSRLVEAIFPLSFPSARALGEHLQLAKSTSPVSILDIGAGSGVWGITLAEQNPLARIRAVDWPRMLEITRSVAARHGLAERFTPAPGDFEVADFGHDHDVAVIGLILHSEGVDRSRRLLRRVFDALKPGGTVAIAEFLCDEDRSGPPMPLLFALNMLVQTEDGDTFTTSEITDWLRETGFAQPRTLDVPAPSPLILATKP